jgi:hypothetical protein
MTGHTGVVHVCICRFRHHNDVGIKGFGISAAYNGVGVFKRLDTRFAFRSQFTEINKTVGLRIGELLEVCQPASLMSCLAFPLAYSKLLPKMLAFLFSQAGVRPIALFNFFNFLIFWKLSR